MLKFSGDTDGAVPTTGTLKWVDSMNRDIIEQWRPYRLPGNANPAGYIVEYDGLTLATVHGSGHMAPQFKPAETYHLIFNWLSHNPI
jgi:serine carboxypeptidase-like clade 1